jgi:hypothetical protein
LDSGQCGQASPETFFVAFSRCSSITVGNGPKVIEHNGPKPHRFRQVPVLMRPKGQELLQRKMLEPANAAFCGTVVGAALTLVRQQLRSATLSQTGLWCSPVEEPQ